MTELALEPALSPEQIAQGFTPQHEENADPGLSVGLLLPKDWKKYEPFGPPPGASGLDLVHFGRYGDDKGKATIELYAQKILRELSSADWFEHFAREREYKVEERHLSESPAGINVVAIATKNGKSGAPFVYRLATYKDGDRVYLVAGFAHPGDFDAFADTFTVATRSFHLLGGGTAPSAEPLRVCRLARVIPVEFAIPQTWRRQVDTNHESAEVERVHFDNPGAEGVHLGRITVAVGRGRSYLSHEEFCEALARGLPGSPILPSLEPVVDGPSSAAAELAHGFVPLPSNRTLRIVVGRLGEDWVGCLLVMNHVTADPFPADAINERALEIALSSIRPAVPTS